jgi:hypothetical protein
MRCSSVRIGNLPDNLSSIIKGEYEGLVVSSIRALLNSDALFCSHGAGCYFYQLIRIKSNLTMRNLGCLIAYEAASRKLEELGTLIPIYYLSLADMN